MSSEGSDNTVQLRKIAAAHFGRKWPSTDMPIASVIGGLCVCRAVVSTAQRFVRAIPASNCSATRWKVPRPSIQARGHNHAFTTIMADDIRFGQNGEWVALRALRAQYYHYQ